MIGKFLKQKHNLVRDQYFHFTPDFAKCHKSPRERIKTKAIQPKIPTTKLCVPRDFNRIKDYRMGLENSTEKFEQKAEPGCSEDIFYERFSFHHQWGFSLINRSSSTCINTFPNNGRAGILPTVTGRSYLSNWQLKYLSWKWIFSTSMLCITTSTS